HSYQILSRAAAEYFAEIGGTGGGLSPDEAARIAWMSMHGVATLLIEHRVNPIGAAKTNRDQLINRTLDVVFSGLQSLRQERSPVAGLKPKEVVAASSSRPRAPCSSSEVTGEPAAGSSGNRPRR